MAAPGAPKAAKKAAGAKKVAKKLAVAGGGQSPLGTAAGGGGLPTVAMAAAPPRPRLAALYQLWTLDVIPGLGQTCAVLCRDHPQEFKNVPAKTLLTLGDLQYRTGFDSTYLDDAGRRALVMPVLGESDGTKTRERSGPFHQSADALRNRAKDFVQRPVYSTGQGQLRDAFRDAATTFQQYLTTVNGNVVDDATLRLGTHFNVVIGILQTKDFANGLGLPPAPAAPPNWPLIPAWDGDGAHLVQAITERAKMPTGGMPIKETEFSQIQRIAFYGAATITATLTDAAIWTTDANTDAAITLAYRWGTAIVELTGPLGVSIR
jgi:hypothetical protein